jgi:2-polyprenyl-3-methyl-5-hydroxy-6-metoxy-1,4-benzoquinol methylase
MRGLLRWLKLFPAMVFPGLCLRNYLMAVRRGMRKYDMLNSPSEDYFCDRYMYIIDKALKPGNLRYDNLKVLDVGCGPGRLTLEFLKRGSRVDALDAMPELLEEAKLNVKKANLNSSGVRWISGEIPRALFKLPSLSYDLIICTEVLYAVPDPQESIKRMIDLLSPGGILVISLRTRLYYLLYFLLINDFERFRSVFENDNFKDIGKSLSWVDPEEMTKTLKDMKLKDINKYGVGVLTGIEGDPAAEFCKPHTLGSKERSFMAKVEDEISDRYPDAGRYIVFTGVKNER